MSEKLPTEKDYYIEVRVLETAKDLFSTEPYEALNEQKLKFINVEAARAYLDRRYGTCKKEAMYQDFKDIGSTQVGWIYCFNDSDISHNSKPWNQQDWVTIHAVKKEITVVV